MAAEQTSCAHCEHIRAEQRVAVVEFGDDRYPGLYCTNQITDPMTARINRGWSAPPSKPPVATCRCDCHMPARIAGALPRLVV